MTPPTTGDQETAFASLFPNLHLPAFPLPLWLAPATAVPSELSAAVKDRAARRIFSVDGHPQRPCLIQWQGTLLRLHLPQAEIHREKARLGPLGPPTHTTGYIHFVSTGFQQINVIKVYVLREANRMGLFHLKDQKKIVTNVVENYFDIAFLVPNHN